MTITVHTVHCIDKVTWAKFVHDCQLHLNRLCTSNRSCRDGNKHRSHILKHHVLKILSFEPGFNDITRPIYKRTILNI